MLTFMGETGDSSHLQQPLAFMAGRADAVRPYKVVCGRGAIVRYSGRARGPAPLPGGVWWRRRRVAFGRGRMLATQHQHEPGVSPLENALQKEDGE